MDAYESKSVRAGVLLDVFRKGHVRHPIRDELEGIDSDTQEGQDVWMR